MYLYIQTIAKQSEVASLKSDFSLIKREQWMQAKNQSQIVLKMIDQVLQGEIPTKIIVANGMGSYTGTRIGVAIANALAFAWNIEIATITTEVFVGDQDDLDWQIYFKTLLDTPKWEKQVHPVYIRDAHIG